MVALHFNLKQRRSVLVYFLDAPDSGGSSNARSCVADVLDHLQRFDFHCCLGCSSSQTSGQLGSVFNDVLSVAQSSRRRLITY